MNRPCCCSSHHYFIFSLLFMSRFVCFQFPVQYGIVLDAGSSHTALYIYKWPAGKENGTGVVTQHSECEVKGIYPSKIKAAKFLLTFCFCVFIFMCGHECCKTMARNVCRDRKGLQNKGESETVITCFKKKQNTIMQFPSWDLVNSRALEVRTAKALSAFEARNDSGISGSDQA